MLFSFFRSFHELFYAPQANPVSGHRFVLLFMIIAVKKICARVPKFTPEHKINYEKPSSFHFLRIRTAENRPNFRFFENIAIFDFSFSPVVFRELFYARQANPASIHRFFLLFMIKDVKKICEVIDAV